MSLLQTSSTPLVFEQREAAFNKLRQFYTDSGQQGETLTSSSPHLLNGTRSLAARRAYLVRLAYKPETRVSAISLITPPELCWAANYYPFNWEMYASLIASHSKIIEVTNKGSNPTPRCSFLNALKGAYIEGILPPPQVILSSSAYCEGVSYVFEELAYDLKVPHIHLDIPIQKGMLGVKNMANQLHEAYSIMCNINEVSPNQGEANLRKTMYLSTKAKHLFEEICKIRDENAPLNLGLEPLHWHFLFSALWGDESGVRICNGIKEDILTLIEKESWRTKCKSGLPIAIFSLIEYGRTNLYKKMIQYNAYTSFEGANYLGVQKLLNPNEVYDIPLDAIFQNMAYNLVNTPMRGGNVKESTEKYMDDAIQRGSKGLVIYSHEQCQMLAPRLHEVEKVASEKGLKNISLNGDCILGIPPGPAGIRLGTFLTNLKEEFDTNETSTNNSHTSTNRSKECKNILRVGVDFGSGYSKYTIVDENSEIVKYSVFNSGIDYTSILDLVKKEIGLEKEFELAITGVGSDNPNFQNISQAQTTEISALIKAIRHLFANHRNLLVIDIGTQDVKIVKFNQSSENPWINTNKSCGAGTGMVLAQILDRWQHSVPDMTFHKLDSLAIQASKAELINTTCGIFAVTNVISALVQSDEERRKVILKGVYQYLATQAIKLLPYENQAGGKIVLTGGLANHKTLRAIFTERGYELLDIPNNIHPQFLVSLGAALSL
jgi:activator of 2-hydroxyglutaryl-CoA dehydratase